MGEVEDFDNYNRSQLIALPDELKFKIFSYLDGFSKIQLLNVCKDTERLIKDPFIIKSLDFSQDHNVSHSDLIYLHEKNLTHLVQKINLNQVYWIPSYDLQSALYKFPNLTALHVVDTSLNFIDVIQLLQHFPQLEKLSFSLQRMFFVQQKHDFRIHVKSLFIKCCHILSLLKFLKKCDALDELWINEERPFNYNRLYATNWAQLIFPTIKKRFMLVQQKFQSKYTRKIMSRFRATNDTTDWRMYSYSEDKFNVTFFFNPEYYNHSDSYKLMKKIHFFDNYLDINNYVKFKYLDLQYENIDDNTLKEIQKVLFSGSASKLNVLKCYTSLFQETRCISVSEYQEFMTSTCPNNINVSNACTIFEKFTSFLSNLEQFVIYDDFSSKCEGIWRVDFLIVLAKLENLKKLHIISSNHITGKFVIEIMQRCKSLTSLTIENRCNRDQIFRYVCAGLPLAKNLKDFRYKSNVQISIDTLIFALTKSPNIERVMINCNNYYSVNPNYLLPSFNNCGNLHFFGLTVSKVFRHSFILTKYLTPYLEKDNKFCYFFSGKNFTSMGNLAGQYNVDELMFTNLRPNVFTYFV